MSGLFHSTSIDIHLCTHTLTQNMEQVKSLNSIKTEESRSVNFWLPRAFFFYQLFLDCSTQSCARRTTNLTLSVRISCEMSWILSKIKNKGRALEMDRTPFLFESIFWLLLLLAILVRLYTLGYQISRNFTLDIKCGRIDRKSLFRFSCSGHFLRLD